MGWISAGTGGGSIMCQKHPGTIHYGVCPLCTEDNIKEGDRLWQLQKTAIKVNWEKGPFLRDMVGVIGVESYDGTTITPIKSFLASWPEARVVNNEIQVKPGSGKLKIIKEEK